MPSLPSSAVTAASNDPEPRRNVDKSTPLDKGYVLGTSVIFVLCTEGSGLSARTEFGRYIVRGRTGSRRGRACLFRAMCRLRASRVQKGLAHHLINALLDRARATQARRRAILPTLLDGREIRRGWRRGCCSKWISQGEKGGAFGVQSIVWMSKGPKAYAHRASGSRVSVCECGVVWLWRDAAKEKITPFDRVKWRTSMRDEDRFGDLGDDADGSKN
jgi:hypothetical protein